MASPCCLRVRVSPLTTGGTHVGYSERAVLWREQFDMSLKAGTLEPEETSVTGQRIGKHIPAARSIYIIYNLELRESRCLFLTRTSCKFMLHIYICVTLPLKRRSEYNREAPSGKPWLRMESSNELKLTKLCAYAVMG
jgi:hypothetical protein